MRKHLDRIRFRGQRRDEFQDLAESPNTSDTEGTEEILIKPRVSIRDSEELREAEGEQQSDAQVHKHTCLIWEILLINQEFKKKPDPDPWNQHNLVVNACLTEPEHCLVRFH